MRETRLGTYYKTSRTIGVGEWLTVSYGREDSSAFRVAMGVARFRLAPYPGSLVQGESVVCLPTPRSTWCPLQNTRGWSITLNGRPQFEVRKSIVVPLQLGLFAARTFRKGEIMGYLEGGGVSVQRALAWSEVRADQRFATPRAPTAVCSLPTAARAGGTTRTLGVARWSPGWRSERETRSSTGMGRGIGPRSRRVRACRHDEGLAILPA